MYTIRIIDSMVELRYPYKPALRSARAVCNTTSATEGDWPSRSKRASSRRLAPYPPRGSARRGALPRSGGCRGPVAAAAWLRGTQSPVQPRAHTRHRRDYHARQVRASNPGAHNTARRRCSRLAHRQRVQFADGRVKATLGDVARCATVTQHLVVEHRRVEHDPNANGVRRSQPLARLCSTVVVSTWALHVNSCAQCAHMRSTAARTMARAPSYAPRALVAYCMWWTGPCTRRSRGVREAPRHARPTVPWNRGAASRLGPPPCTWPTKARVC